MLVKPVKLHHRSRNIAEIPCTHITVKEELAEDGVTLMAVVIEICGGPPDGPKRVHLPADADEFYVMDDRGNHQNSYRWKRMLEASLQQKHGVPARALSAPSTVLRTAAEGGRR